MYLCPLPPNPPAAGISAGFDPDLYLLRYLCISVPLPFFLPHPQYLPPSRVIQYMGFIYEYVLDFCLVLSSCLLHLLGEINHILLYSLPGYRPFSPAIHPQSPPLLSLLLSLLSAASSGTEPRGKEEGSQGGEEEGGSRAAGGEPGPRCLSPGACNILYKKIFDHCRTIFAPKIKPISSSP